MGIAYSIAPVFELPLMFYVGVLVTRCEHAKLIMGALGLGVTVQIFALHASSAAVVAVMSGVAITFFQNFLPNQAGSATNVYSSSARIGATAGYLGRRDRRTGIGQCSA